MPHESTPAPPPGAVESNMAAYYSAYGAAAGWLVESPGLAAYATPIPHPLFNGAVVSGDPGAQLDAAATRLGAALAERGLAGLWWLSPAADRAGVGDRLATLGLSEAGAVPAMLAGLDELPEDPPLPGLIIRRAASAADRATWGRIAALGTGFAGPAVAALATLEPALPDGRMARQVRYIGEAEGEPVATAALMLDRGLAGVFAVTTLPQARRRGIGRALTLRALRDGRAAGARIGSLQASAMGRPVYEALGFREVFAYRLFRQG